MVHPGVFVAPTPRNRNEPNRFYILNRIRPLACWRIIPHLNCMRNAREFPLLPAALASVPFGFVFGFL